MPLKSKTKFQNFIKTENLFNLYINKYTINNYKIAHFYDKKESI